MMILYRGHAWAPVTNFTHRSSSESRSEKNPTRSSNSPFLVMLLLDDHLVLIEAHGEEQYGNKASRSLISFKL